MLLANLRRILIEHRRQPKPLLLKSLVSHQRPAQVAGTHEQHIPGLVRPQNLPHLGDQILHPIPDPRMPKLPKVRQVLSHLGIGEPQRLAQLLRRDRPAVLALKCFQLAKVKAQSADGGIGNQLRSGMLHDFPKTQNTNENHSPTLAAECNDSPG
jgi:hypothetical protein